ncbi:hypothetical protein O6H91_05G001200 [Diphasiastrum complanatum]|uniref:Uncharacterized protein n=2 Tax=Diphasiastrum complanatum TaxID=34168 RepID=A0ACC2DKD4_DIPCM|nr:hypothetical protein O6H91_05G001200 [Diphasiastrum complanatum]KAJ7554618.1 hypothetical protein O6H91_05G001200 [Diphasiastrum complanatum]
MGSLCMHTSKAYAKNRRGTEALECLHRMQLYGMKPNHVTLVSALDACKNKAALEKGRQIHAAIVSEGYGGQSVVGNALINMYAKCGSLDSARNVFMGMPRRDVISWNAVISACTLNGHREEALDFFDRMHGEGFKPDEVTFVCALDACASLAAIEKGIEVHAAIVESGYEDHMIVATSLVKMYGKCGKLDDARSVFNRMPKRNKISWSAMMSACNQNACPKEALNLFTEMQHNRIEQDQVAFVCALDACAILADLEQGHKIHAAIVREGYEDHVVVGNALVNMYGKCRSLEDARNVFQRMPYRDVISWNAIIAVCSQNVQSRLALDLYDQMRREGFKPGAVTFVCALEACASLVDLEKGQEIHGAIVHGGCDGEIIVGTALINMYGKCGILEDARNVFNRMVCRDVVSWSAMIAACVLNNDAKKALDLFNQMQCNGFMPDQFTFACALDACASLAALEKGQEIHAATIKAQCEGQVVVATALVNMYGKCGSLEDARNVFDHMPHRNLVCWNAIIAACARNGHGIEAIELFKHMQCCGFKPDGATFLSLLAACSHSGTVDEARHFFKSMTEHHGLTQNVEHYLCLIDILGRAGHLKDAEDFINDMPYEKETRVWLSLLWHCQIHGDMERGIRAARHALNSDPRNATAYVLLSNIYAEAGTREA